MRGLQLMHRHMGRAAALAGALGLAVILAGCEAQPDKPLAHTQAISIAGRVKVLNGDTLVIDGRHVHLANASTPQGALHARCWSEALLSTEVNGYVRDLVVRGVSIDFKPNGQTDSYNRALGTVTLDGNDLGEELFQRGMAARLTEPRFDWCQPISQNAEGSPPFSALVKLGE